MTYEQFILSKVINTKVENYNLLLESVLQTSVAPSIYLKDKLTKQKVSIGLKTIFGDLIHKNKNTSVNFYFFKEYRKSILGLEPDRYKVCKKCLLELPITEFFSNGFKSSGERKFKSTCKKCNKSLCKERFRGIVERSLGSYSCKLCGYNKCEQALEFHHINHLEKEFKLSEMLTHTEDKILKELDKCLLVCANCHREIHYGFYPEYLA